MANLGRAQGKKSPCFSGGDGAGDGCNTPGRLTGYEEEEGDVLESSNMSAGESRANSGMDSNENRPGVIRGTGNGGVLMQHITHLDLKRELDESESQSSESASETFSGHGQGNGGGGSSSGFVSPGRHSNGSGSSSSKLR